MKLRGYVANISARLRSILPPLVFDAIGLSGCGLIVYGSWLIYVPAGFIIAGLMMVTGVWLGARRG